MVADLTQKINSMCFVSFAWQAERKFDWAMSRLFQRGPGLQDLGAPGFQGSVVGHVGLLIFIVFLNIFVLHGNSMGPVGSHVIKKSHQIRRKTMKINSPARPNTGPRRSHVMQKVHQIQRKYNENQQPHGAHHGLPGVPRSTKITLSLKENEENQKPHGAQHGPHVGPVWLVIFNLFRWESV